MKNLTIRKATIKDYNIIDEFQKKLVNFERKFDKSILKDSRYYSEKTLRKMLKAKTCLVLLAEIKNKPVGCIIMDIVKTKGSWCVYKRKGVLDLLLIKKQYKKKGIGKRLVQDSVKWLKSKNIKQIELEVYANNDKAIKAYKKLGFKDHVIIMKI